MTSTTKSQIFKEIQGRKGRRSEKCKADLYEQAVSKMKSRLHLKLYEAHNQFFYNLTPSSAKQALTNVLSAMTETYLAFLEHSEETSPSSCSP